MRLIASVAVLIGLNSIATGQTYVLEGQIISGTTLFTVDEPRPGIVFDGMGYPEGGYPVDYSGLLSVNADQGLWTFGFSATDDLETVDHTVDGPSAAEELPTNVLLASTTDLTIDFNSGFGWTTDFELEIDLPSETGSWTWSQDCAFCDLAWALPGATATVTSVTVVPEPTSVTLLLVGLVGVRLVSRRRN
ncbi:hypothetical protein NG895_26230 [Aeoliella sp. ICT_H6.2]|uniref:PEP-CTERM protein-sorting domain-containing protein n=1 Tax=Aeoliella straminimaris TaxID=2954799 RepID=A0A9X2FJL3_9BACT|nr:hypothetical protein [Aeoliella straminimaris]MCO6047416.1 hypothetical protein [Aeoliella straminimaris]